MARSQNLVNSVCFQGLEDKPRPELWAEDLKNDDLIIATGVWRNLLIVLLALVGAG